MERELAAWETVAQHAADGTRDPNPPERVHDHHSLMQMASVEQRGVRLPYQPPGSFGRCALPGRGCSQRRRTSADFRESPIFKVQLELVQAYWPVTGSSPNPCGRVDEARACAAQTAAPIVEALRRCTARWLSWAALPSRDRHPSSWPRRERVVLLEATGEGAPRCTPKPRIAFRCARRRGNSPSTVPTFEFYREAAAPTDTSNHQLQEAPGATQKKAEAILARNFRERPAGRSEWTGEVE